MLFWESPRDIWYFVDLVKFHIENFQFFHFKQLFRQRSEMIVANPNTTDFRAEAKINWNRRDSIVVNVQVPQRVEDAN